MEPEVQEAPVRPTGDQLLAELRPQAKESKSQARVPLRLKLKEASYLWERLYKATAKGTKFTRKTLARDPDELTFPPLLLETLWNALEDLPATTPYAITRSGHVHFLERRLTLEFLPHEVKYLRTILRNRKRDKWRRRKRERERFLPFELVDAAEDGTEKEDLSDGIRRPFFRPTHHENPAAHLRRFFLKTALRELPAKLKMTAKDVHALLAELAEAEGNVSEAARKLGQPQRKTARRIVRIQQYLLKRGFSA